MLGRSCVARDSATRGDRLDGLSPSFRWVLIVDTAAQLNGPFFGLIDTARYAGNVDRIGYV